MANFKVRRRWVLGAAAAVMLLGGTAAMGQAPSAAASADARQLVTQAIGALRAGETSKTAELLDKAAGVSQDPAVQKMAAWTREFVAQRTVLSTERRKQYDKAAGDVQTLLAAGRDDYAAEATVRAYVLAEDKKAFRNEAWVDAIVGKTVGMAKASAGTGDVLRALRLYSDLSQLEPANATWKEALKDSERRLRVVALYAPDRLKMMRDQEIAALKEKEQILPPPPTKAAATRAATTTPVTVPTTAPSTGPATSPAAEADSFRIDWRDALRGVQVEMLWQALLDTRRDYWREVSLKDMVVGGIGGLRTLATTPGVEETFPGLKDAAKKAAFIAYLDAADAKIGAAEGARELLVGQEIVRGLRGMNAGSLVLPDEVVVSEFGRGALAACDPFTTMIWPSDLAEFDKQTQGEFSGVGIQIQSDDDGSLKVVSPLEDSPAFRAGVKAGDSITHINGRPAKGITLDQAIKTITGPTGTPVTLTVRSFDGSSRDLTLLRETIKVASIKGYTHRPGGGWDWLIDPESRIAYLRMTAFTRTTTEELDRAASELRAQGARGVILDLRYNPGGLLSSAIEVSNKFLSEGDIVSTRPDRATRNQPTVARASKETDEIELPTVVLVNQYSASAAEIVSGALKDQKRAFVIGERTYGKGSVQLLYPLDNRKACLKLTIAHYYLPSGRCLHREENSTEWGVDPDLRVEMTPEQMRAAQEARSQMDVLRAANAAGEPPTTQSGERKDPLATDPQLSAAVLMLRLSIAGSSL